MSIGGFDLHHNWIAQHSALIGRVADAMRAFYDTAVAMGVAERVTCFAAPDFGRTLQSNDDGWDHGRGSMHFAMGGAVKSGRIYGAPPAVANGTMDDVGQWRLIPTIAADQYAAKLAGWFGVTDGDLRTVLSNIGNYDAADWKLGFL